MASRSTVQPIVRDRAETIRDEIARLQVKLDRYENLPKDEYGPAAIVVFTKQFNNAGLKYTYACVKGGGFWFVTGRPDRYSWEGLLDFVYNNLSEDGSVEAHWVSELTSIV